MPLYPLSFNSPDCPSVYLPCGVEDDRPFDPLGALLSRQHGPDHSRERFHQAMLSPLCLATVQNKIEFIRFMLLFDNVDAQRDLNLALFLANRQGFKEIASLLLDYGAKPGQGSSANGLHGAAWCGLTSNISKYVNTYGASPGVTDGSSATPIIYAILGTQDEERAWLTIHCLFVLGASPLPRFGSEELSYAEIAQKDGKGYLARRLKECETCPSPTVMNSSRESSCTPGGVMMLTARDQDKIQKLMEGLIYSVRFTTRKRESMTRRTTSDQEKIGKLMRESNEHVERKCMQLSGTSMYHT